MGEKKRRDKNNFIFKKRNYKIMILGLIIIAVGFILMSGGGSEDPNIFSPDIYNFRRIRLAPTLVLLGLGIQIYAILSTTDKE
ncbi:DUF3098 domain-containing protein [Flavobacteriaceae bacterium]|jgi:hypothetical protein|nr:DUF3098 domain-containing protein [Flavobacteriaceae bacterium]MDC0477793.1 DUF3098 domain-containing protein [Flavobacteriaceae bacterium]MDC1371793.1 DUF3098 domain-containing protein [Flavobacteriaceae bacterium]